jgi:hypothetical protein
VVPKWPPSGELWQLWIIFSQRSGSSTGMTKSLDIIEDVKAETNRSEGIRV